MKSYCLKCRKDTENITSRVSNTSNDRAVLLSQYAICSSKKSRFIKNQEAKKNSSFETITNAFEKILKNLIKN